MPTTPTSTTLHLTDLFCRDDVAALTDAIGLPADSIADPAIAAAATYQRTGIAVVNLEPGDMTRYQLVLTDLGKHAHLGLPGDLQVSLINLCGGRTFCTASDGYLDNYDVHGFLSLPHDDVNPHTVIVVTAFVVTFLATLQHTP